MQTFRLRTFANGRNLAPILGGCPFVGQRRVGLMPMSENPIFLNRQTGDKHREQRQTE
jgi:hypothetical protein